MAGEINGSASMGMSDSGSAGTVTRHLIPEWKAGNPKALGELCRRFQNRVWGLAQTKLTGLGIHGRHVSADDATQDVFLRISSHDPTAFKRVNDSESFFQFIAMIVCDHCIDEKRMLTAQKRGGGRVTGESELPDDGSRSPLDGLARGDHEWEAAIREQCQRLFDAVSDPDRALLGMMQDGLTNQEMADVLAVSLASLKRRITALKALLQSQRDDESMA